MVSEVNSTRPNGKASTKLPPKGDKVPKQQTPKKPSSTKRKCYHCGRDQDHKLKECPGFGQTCNTCGKKNHFALVCLSSKSTKQHVHALADENDTDEEIFQIEEVSSVKGQGKQIFANLNFLSDSGRLTTELKCQLDTSVTCNVISYDDLSRIAQTENPQLQDSRFKLRLFDGSLMILVGTASLNVEYNNNQNQIAEVLQFQVAKANNKPLLSAEMCEKLLDYHSYSVIRRTQL